MKKKLKIIVILLVCFSGYYVFKTQILMTEENAESRLKSYVKRNYSDLEYEFGRFWILPPFKDLGRSETEYVLDVYLKDNEGKCFAVYGHGLTIYDNYDYQILGI